MHRGKNLSVIYVEDDSVIQENTAKTLRFFFNDVLVADNGVEALVLLKKMKPDILITDYVMPLMNGYDLIVEAKKLYPDLIVFITSSYTDKDKLLKCIPLGIADYLVKPINYEKFVNSIYDAIEKKEEPQNQTTIMLSEGISYQSELKQLISGERHIILSRQEADIIELFIKHRGKILSKNFIMGYLYHETVDDNLLKNTIYRIRKKVGHDIVITMKNMGYLLK